MRLRNGLILAIILFGIALGGMTKIGTTAAPMLKVGIGRATGMGDAFVAVADDASSAYWNPAGLAMLTSRQITVNHIDWIADVNHDFLTFALPLSIGTVAFSVTSLTMGDMRYTLTDDATTPAREDTWAGPNFGASEFALALSYSRLITDRLAFGFTAKTINEMIWDNSASGIGADVGLFYITGFKSLKMGMVVSNFGSEMVYTGRQLDFADTTKTTNPPATYQTEPAPLPTIFRFGLSYNLIEKEKDYLLVAVDLVHPSDVNETINFGFEYCLNQLLFLRTGYIFNTDGEYGDEIGRKTGLSAGLGVAFKIRNRIDLKLDIGYRFIDYIGNSPRVTLNLGF